MHMLKLLGITTALLGGAYADVWAQFCDDNQCGGCGESVDVTGPGCLGETGRNSILFHNSNGASGQGYALKWFSDGSCGDQVQCSAGFVPDSGCIDLNGNPFASSFEFVQSC